MLLIYKINNYKSTVIYLLDFSTDTLNKLCCTVDSSIDLLLSLRYRQHFVHICLLDIAMFNMWNHMSHSHIKTLFCGQDFTCFPET